MNSPGQWVPNMLLENSGEIIPEKMKSLSQSKKDAELWLCLVVQVKSDAVKNNIAQEPGMLVPESREIGSDQTGDGKSECQNSRNQ